MRRYLVFAALGLVGVGCSDRPDGNPPAQGDDALAVYEAAFRYRLQKRPADAIAYLSVDDQDPPAELLRRLRRDWPNLKPVSEEPKEKGLRVYVKGLKWIDRDTAELRAGHWLPTRSAGEGYFADHRVVREGGRWVVAQVTNETMS
jgi:hypothetical protein